MRRVSVLPLLSLRRYLLVLVVVAVGAACTGDEASPNTTLSTDAPPVAVVTELMQAVDEGRFDDAAALSDPVQAALLALVEGASATEVVRALGDDQSESVAANFWSGFAQTLEDSWRSAELTFVEEERVTEGDERFAPVMVTSGSGEQRAFVLRDEEDGWTVDLFATFGPVLAERLLAPVESVLGSASSDAAVVRSHLSATADSLAFAASDPGLPIGVHQSLLALIERVTRTG